MKKKFFMLAAAGALICGMSACGHKAESATDASEAQGAEEQVIESEANMEESADPVVDAAGETEVVEVAEPAAGEAPAAKSDYTVTPSGLKYKVIKKGSGKKPTATDVVEVNYEGRLLDGTVFDSSAKHGQSISFPLNRVIKGWTEGLQLMPVGSVYEFYIPADLAYGPQALPGIPANSDLIFTVELLDVK